MKPMMMQVVGVMVGSMLLGCSQRTSSPADQPINSSAAISSTNDTLRVNQPRAFNESEIIGGQGTNLQIAEAAGANKAVFDSGNTVRLKSVFDADPALTIVSPHIQIIERNGKTVLKGTVETMAQKSAILEKARQVVGDNKVEDALEVRIGPDSPPIQKQATP